MKTVTKTSVKNGAQRGAIAVIKTIATPLHIGLQVGTNIVAAVGQKAADSVCDAEGFLTHAIDKSKDAKTVAQSRYDFTHQKMYETAMQFERIKNAAQNGLKKADKAIKDSADKIKKAVSTPDDMAEEKNEFYLAQLRATRDELKKDPELNKDAIIAVNRAISKCNLKNNKMPKLCPVEAFGPVATT